LKKRLLLADPSPSVERKIAAVLVSEGIEVTAVTDGYAAERSLDQCQPDLVLADVFLLGKSGYELCRSIKQDPRFAGLPVVLLVGSFEPFDAAAAARLGADGKLTKPIEPAGLIDMTRRFLGAPVPSSDGAESALNSEPALSTEPALNTEPVLSAEPPTPAPIDQSADIELRAASSPLPIQSATDTSAPDPA